MMYIRTLKISPHSWLPQDRGYVRQRRLRVWTMALRLRFFPELAGNMFWDRAPDTRIDSFENLHLAVDKG